MSINSQNKPNPRKRTKEGCAEPSYWLVQVVSTAQWRHMWRVQSTREVLSCSTSYVHWAALRTSGCVLCGAEWNSSLRWYHWHQQHLGRCPLSITNKSGLSGKWSPHKNLNNKGLQLSNLHPQVHPYCTQAHFTSNVCNLALTELDVPSLHF